MWKKILLFVMKNTLIGAGCGLLASIPVAAAVEFDWPVVVSISPYLIGLFSLLFLLVSSYAAVVFLNGLPKNID